ncbi:MAG: Na+/H+ antiporter NhaA [Bacteroidetes bacterium]|nr:Na+/H+ antiporter NhaA [Bacteroidota bacterium]
MKSSFKIYTTSPLPVDAILKPFQQFASVQASGGILLLFSALVALIWANSAFSESYQLLFHIPVTIGFSDLIVSKPLFLWINDGLMAVFFFVVGLEIKRELLTGELNSIKKAALPVAAALGGMIAPALIYTSFNIGTPGTAGWGIPMATDIAFALGILAMIGSRVPLQLKIFLTALAIIDDLGAVLVIALFYTSEISLLSLVIGGGILLLLFLLNRIGVRNPSIYLFFGFFLWLAFLKSGIHATLAGVLLAISIPSATRIQPFEFEKSIEKIMSFFRQVSGKSDSELKNEDQASAIQSIKTVCEHAESPAEHLEHKLHPWVIWFIMPVFALANAGITLNGSLGSLLANEISYGVIMGLVIGKQAGIFTFSWLAVKLNFATLPTGISWIQIYGISALAGIGFTMSLFIAGLAFAEGELLNSAKAGIILGSVISGITGWLILKKTLK